MKESVLQFACKGEHLVGVLAEPADTLADVGVLIIVGGPQYRVGSHRQFVLLARRLAASGFAALRFDYRSMGDSTGAPRDFLGVTADLGAAIDALLAARPPLKRVVLWGLCDAASAILLYLNETRDARVAGMILLNPWVRTHASEARVQVKHYYFKRLMQPAFWRKLLSGGVARQAAGEFASKVLASRKVAPPADFVQIMARTWVGSEVPLTVLLSGNDFVAKEFSDRLDNDPAWSSARQRSNLVLHSLATADHTFSTLAEQQRAEDICVAAVQALSA